VPKLFLFIGPSGSGKSTQTKQIIKHDPSYFRVNRDDMRKQLFGEINADYYNSSEFRDREKIVSDLLHDQVRYFLLKGMNVILDNTHLQKKYVNGIINDYNHLADIEIRFFKIDFDEAVKRLKVREGIDYDTKYLKAQYKDYETVYQEFKNLRFYPRQITTYNPSKDLPKCIICDLDGTLSLFDRDKRNPYNRDFENDDVNIPVLMLVQKSLEEGHKIIFFSGRSESFREQTMMFLTISCGLDEKDFTLYMRSDKDNRSDVFVKLDMFKAYIEDKYQVLFAVDDRLKILENVWNKLGINILSANQTNERF